MEYKKTLHILRSEPDDLLKKLLSLTKQDDDKVVKLYEGEVDWEGLVDDIFEYDKVISWW